jgi:type 1 glutamine amidotransferase
MTARICPILLLTAASGFNQRFVGGGAKSHGDGEFAVTVKQLAHPSVWIVKDAKARIVCITLGHAAEAHGNPAFKTLLTNAAKWAGGK